MGMRPKPSLGQNFLKNPGIAEKIAAFSGVEQGDTVLEIGPGKGALTGALLKVASRIVAVEKDDELFELLKKQFSDEPRLTLVHGDVLDLDMSTLISPGTKVVANLPYNIATRVILRLAEVSPPPATVVVMVQKEVAKRICAPVGHSEYSALTVLLSGVFLCDPGFVVGPKNFFPEPKVDSRVIRLVPRQNPLPPSEREAYQRVVLCSFAQRRKMLRNSLLGLPGITKQGLSDLARLADIDLQKRPQDLSWEEYARLGRAYRQIITS